MGYVNASLEGVGAVCNNEFYESSIPQSYKRALKIVHFEMVNILLACRIWENSCENSRVKLFCDNSEVVEVIARNRTKNGCLGAILRELS